MNIFLGILGLIVSIALLVGIYYLLKILLAYILYTLLLGAIVGGIFLYACSHIAPDYMKEAGIVGAVIGGVLGLVCAVMQTKDIAKSDLAKNIAKDLTKTDPKGTKYTVRDQYGNTKTVKKTGNSVLGDTYYKDSEGNSYESTYGSNELE